MKFDGFAEENGEPVGGGDGGNCFSERMRIQLFPFWKQVARRPAYEWTEWTSWTGWTRNRKQTA